MFQRLEGVYAKDLSVSDRFRMAGKMYHITHVDNNPVALVDGEKFITFHAVSIEKYDESEIRTTVPALLLMSVYKK